MVDLNDIIHMEIIFDDEKPKGNLEPEAKKSAKKIGERRMNVNTIVKNLNKNVDVVESTFTQNNLQVISYGFCGIHGDNGWMQLLIEVASIDGASINNSVSVKANFYDEDNIIIYSYDTELDEDDFAGYDTLHLYLNEDNLAFNTVKCRLFATRA